MTTFPVWNDPEVLWGDPDTRWGGTLQGKLWVNDAGTWREASHIHPYAHKGTWKDPLEVWAFKGGVTYGCWPVFEPVIYPPIVNLRVTANTSTSINVAWDALAVTPIRYRISWAGGSLTEQGGLDNGLATTASKTGLTVDTQYTVTVWAEYSDGNTEFATLVASTGSSTPPSITSWTPQTYNSVNVVLAGTAPFTLRCVGGTRNGNTYSYPSAGTNSIGGCVGKEYWQFENAGGVTSRFYTDDGTPAQSAVVGAVRTSLANPLPSGFGRGSSSGINWGVPPMAAHANFPYSNCNDGTGATRFQTGNYPRGWIQHQIGIPSNYRVRRFMFVQGDGAGNTEVVTPVYSVDSGATFKRWSHFGGVWVPATDATINPGGTSPNGLLSNDSGGSYDRDWNWRLTSAATLATPFIPENGTDLGQRWIYVRWGIVHLTGSFGANMGECWIEYQEPSTPAKAEVKATIAYG